jgi:cytochrome c oxidase accessory protein FixG
VFIWIERWIEGDRQKRIKLDNAPWNAEKVLRKTTKQIIWIAFAAWTGFTFVGFFTPIRELGGNMLSLSLGPWETFWTIFYGFATYGNAGFLREQVCKYMCPYARFQSAMFDKDTMIISYDAERGDPRGTRGRKTDLKAANLGHCIDCGLCVQVCPTGIDIRKGLQYECIGCAACIDVCDGVMDKMNYPRGLVRYATLNGLAHHWTRSQMLRHVLRPRVLVYTGILFLIVGAVLTSLWLRSPFKVDVVRDRASLARLVDDGWIENVYRVQVMNATERPQRYRVVATGIDGARVEPAGDFTVAPADALWVPLAVRVPPQAAEQQGAGAHALQLHVERLPTAAGDQPVELTEKTTFMIPQ